MAKPLTVSNNRAAFGWVFMAIWIGMLCLFTYLAIRDGGMPGTDPLFAFGVIGLFWLFGLGGLSYFLAVPCTRLVIDGQQAVVTERAIPGLREERCRKTALKVPPVAEEKDEDGDPYFVWRIVTPSGRHVPLSESADRVTVERVRDKVIAAIG